MWVDVLISLLSDPVRVYLLVGDILATFAVGLGIISEHGPEKVRRAADRLVIGGVIAETIFSVLLFSYDGTLNFEQQSKIGALDTEVSDTRDTAKTAVKKEEQTAEREQQTADKANDLAQDNIRLWARLADREVSSEQRATIRRMIRGNGQQVTVVMPTMREPQAYGQSIAKALKAAGFDVLFDFWKYDLPPDTGVVFCENQQDDLRIYNVLRLARVVTKLIGPANNRDAFCDRPGIEAPFELIIGNVTGGLITPATVGRLLPHGFLAKWHGPRIYVGQKPE